MGCLICVYVSFCYGVFVILALYTMTNFWSVRIISKLQQIAYAQPSWKCNYIITVICTSIIWIFACLPIVGQVCAKIICMLVGIHFALCCCRTWLWGQEMMFSQCKVDKSNSELPWRRPVIPTVYKCYFYKVWSDVRNNFMLDITRLRNIEKLSSDDKEEWYLNKGLCITFTEILQSPIVLSDTRLDGKEKGTKQESSTKLSLQQ